MVSPKDWRKSEYLEIGVEIDAHLFNSGKKVFIKKLISADIFSETLNFKLEKWTCTQTRE